MHEKRKPEIKDIVERYAPSIREYVVRRLGGNAAAHHAADDIVQTVWQRVLLSQEKHGRDAALFGEHPDVTPLQGLMGRYVKYAVADWIRAGATHDDDIHEHLEALTTGDRHGSYVHDGVELRDLAQGMRSFLGEALHRPRQHWRPVAMGLYILTKAVDDVIVPTLEELPKREADYVERESGWEEFVAVDPVLGAPDAHADDPWHHASNSKRGSYAKAQSLLQEAATELGLESPRPA